MNVDELFSIEKIIYEKIPVLEDKRLYKVAFERIFNLAQNIMKTLDKHLQSKEKKLFKWMKGDYILFKKNIFEYEVEDGLIFRSEKKEFYLNELTLKVYFFYLKSILERI